MIPDYSDDNSKICDLERISDCDDLLDPDWIWEKANFIVTPLSTSSLEAALRGLPSVVDLTNGKQVTIAHGRYLTHLSDFLNEDFILNLYDLKQIENREFLGKMNFNPSKIRLAANFYCNLDTKNG